MSPTPARMQRLNWWQREPRRLGFSCAASSIILDWDGNQLIGSEFDSHEIRPQRLKCLKHAPIPSNSRCVRIQIATFESRKSIHLFDQASRNPGMRTLVVSVKAGALDVFAEGLGLLHHARLVLRRKLLVRTVKAAAAARPHSLGCIQDTFMIHRRVLLTTLLGLGGCAVGQTPYAPPAESPLQAPLPGRALIYLIRIPYDDLPVNVRIAEQLVAVLPATSYTAFDLSPQSHNLTTFVMDSNKIESEVAPPFLLNLSAGERTLLYLSGSTDQSRGAISIALIGGFPITTGPMSRRRITGGRVWKQANDLDAQGLLSIATLKLPE